MTARAALMLAVTADLGFAAGALVAGFLHHNPAFDGDILVLHDGLPETELAALARLSPRVQPRAYDRATALRRLALAPPAALDRLGRWGAMTLAKFELFDLLDRYATVVWMDADILVQGAVPELWQAGPLAWRPLPPGALDRRRAALAALDPTPLAPPLPLPNAGVVVAQAALHARGIRAASLYAWAARLLTETPATAVDELALYLLARAHGLPVQELPSELNHPADQPGSAAARLVHAIGPDKFWNAAPLRQGFPNWNRAHARWTAAGGAPAPAPDRLLAVHPADPAEVLVFARNRAFWQALWPDLGPAIPRGLWPDLRSERAFLRLYAQGQHRHAWVELARTASDRRLRLSIGTEPRKLRDPSLPARIAAAVQQAPLPLRHHAGRRLTVWETEQALDDVPEAVQALRDALLTALYA